MAALTVQSISESGLTPTFSAASAGGDSYANDDRTFLVVKNGGAGSITVTITAQRTSFQLEKFGNVTFSNMQITVGAGSEAWIKAPVAPYSDASGKAQVSYSGTSSVTVAAIRMPGG